MSIPQFFFGMVAILIFALNLHWLPVGGADNASDGALVGTFEVSDFTGTGPGLDPDGFRYEVCPFCHAGQYEQGLCEDSTK